MACFASTLTAITFLLGSVVATEVSTHVAANPIRKVVTMLTALKAKVESEAEKEEELYKKYMCYCKTSSGTLQASVADAEGKIPEVSSTIEESEAQKTQLEDDLVKHKADREAAKESMAEATAMREKEAAAYAGLKAQYGDDITAIEKAVAALEKGMGGSFLQKSGAARTLQALFQRRSEIIDDSDRQDVVAFLAGGEEYAPKSGQITGILKQMGDEMAKGLADETATEEAAIKAFEGLMSAKKKEVEALTVSIEDKSIRVGDLGVSIANLKVELGDAEEALLDDKKFLADLEKNCATKTAEWDTIVKSRSEELVALSDTIKILNDDDALELFKKALPSSASSFVQLTVSTATVRSRALAALRAQGKHTPALDFISLALHGKKVGFEKVIGMIDEMVAVLKKDQTTDDEKKQYCATEFDTADDEKKRLELAISDADTAISVASDSLTTLSSEITALGEAIKALDKMVTEATEQRKAENADYTELMAQDSAAKDLIGFAKNRLNKFYNPKLYLPPPAQELSEEDRIVVNMGGTAPPTPAPGGIAGSGVTAFVQVAAHVQLKDSNSVAPPPPPESFGAYSKKSEGSTGVIAMLDLLVKDLDKEMTVAETEEKAAQAEYEKLVEDSKAKRADDSKLLSDKDSLKAETEGELQTQKDSKASAGKELGSTNEYIASLHADCDWLVQYFEARKQARADEIASLANAKAVLSGADFSLIQKVRTRVRQSLRGRQI